MLVNMSRDELFGQFMNLQLGDIVYCNWNERYPELNGIAYEVTEIEYEKVVKYVNGVSTSEACRYNDMKLCCKPAYALKGVPVASRTFSYECIVTKERLEEFLKEQQE